MQRTYWCQQKDRIFQAATVVLGWHEKGEDSNVGTRVSLHWINPTGTHETQTQSRRFLFTDPIFCFSSSLPQQLLRFVFGYPLIMALCSVFVSLLSFTKLQSFFFLVSGVNGGSKQFLGSSSSSSFLYFFFWLSFWFLPPVSVDGEFSSIFF